MIKLKLVWTIRTCLKNVPRHCLFYKFFHKSFEINKRIIIHNVLKIYIFVIPSITYIQIPYSEQRYWNSDKIPEWQIEYHLIRIESRIEITILSTIANYGKKKLSMNPVACGSRSLPDLENATAVYERLTQWTFITRRYAVCRADARFLLVYLSEQKNRESEREKEREWERKRECEREWERNCTRRRCLVLVCCETCICLLLHIAHFSRLYKYILYTVKKKSVYISRDRELLLITLITLIWISTKFGYYWYWFLYSKVYSLAIWCSVFIAEKIIFCIALRFLFIVYIITYFYLSILLFKYHCF